MQGEGNEEDFFSSASAAFQIPSTPNNTHAEVAHSGNFINGLTNKDILKDSFVPYFGYQIMTVTPLKLGCSREPHTTRRKSLKPVANQRGTCR